MRHGRRTVLVAQKSTAEQRRMVSLCRTMGASIEAPVSFTELTAVLEMVAIDTLILDCGCMGMPVERLLRAARLTNSRCPAIVTAWPEQMGSACVEERLHRLGMVSLLVRPFRYHELSRVLSRLLHVGATTRVVRRMRRGSARMLSPACVEVGGCGRGVGT